MLPDYRGAKAVREIKQASAKYVNRRTIENPGDRTFIEQLDVRIEAKLHGLVERRRSNEPHHWHWPHPLAH